LAEEAAMTVVEEGQLKGSFRGFKNRETVFQFFGGHLWRQKQYKYHYYYAYMPHARVVDRNGGFELEVDGMSDSVEVVRVR
jgi:hypothetical protein